MLKILITGGAGFIGSNFVEYLLERYNYKIIVLDALTYAGNLDNFPLRVRSNPNFQFWQGNIRNSELVNELVEQVDTVFHFAAETHVARSIYDNSAFFETDVLGTQVLANAVLKHPVDRFIHISSSEVYGTAEYEPMDEKHPLKPMSPYASAKAGADRLVYSYFVTYGVPAVIIRPFNNYGPRQHLEKVVPRFITSAISKQPLPIHGKGLSSRDWLYVEDHCKALDKVLHGDISKLKGEVINLGTGINININKIAEIILEKSGSNSSLINHTDDRLGQVMTHISSKDKAKRLLSWEPETSFEDGVERTIEWYKQNSDWWEKLIWMKSVPIRTVNGQKIIY